MDDLRFPIGPFELPAHVDAAARAGHIQSIADTPGAIAGAVHGWSDERLDTPYRPGGWTVRQLLHHVPDSHMNAYVRLKLALTEDTPTIKPYDEARWAELPDSRQTPVAVSLQMLDLLHRRWVTLLRAMDERDFARTWKHPERGDRALTLDHMVALYAWHGRHHTAHITRLADRMGW